MANCWSTTARMPSALADLMTERILVPKTLLPRATGRRSPRSGTGFMTCTPPASSAKTVVDLEERQDALLAPQVLATRHTLNFSVQGVLEKDRA